MQPLPILIAAWIASSLLAPVAALAFSLTPMSVTFDAGQKSGTQSFTVDNSASERIAVQVSMAERKVTPDGFETNPDADDDFIVYPSQLVLEPNEKRSIRVTWAGEAKPTHELAYRIIAEQLPVETTKPDHKSHAVIKMLLRYMGAVYITPRGARPDIKLKKLTGQTVKGQKMLALEIENAGTAHHVLKNVTLKIGEGASAVELGRDELKPLLGENLLAGGVRKFVVPWPEKLDGGLKPEALQGQLETND